MVLISPYSGLDSTDPVALDGREGVPERVHVFDDDSRLAIKSALAATRPLLVRGEPGVGKTQLAAAAAKALGRVMVSHVVDARTESRDLLWHFDSVRRLAEAQLCGALKLKAADVEKRLDLKRFVSPGPLWWGFDWRNASEHASEFGGPVPVHDPDDVPGGFVVLIDEIDKADTDVPNGLLEALGSGRFTPHGCPPVEMSEPAPLVVVTTNEERVLPDAFVRRCLVLHLQLPDADDELVELLVSRGAAHFPEASNELLTESAQLLVSDRRVADPPLPGQAEFLDLIRAVRRLADMGEGSEGSLLRQISRFTLRKHSGSRR